MDAAVTMQLLELTKKMLDSGKKFHLSLTITGGNSDFTFSTGSQEREETNQQKPLKKMKMKSPSQKKRDGARMQNFLEKGDGKPPSKKSSETLGMKEKDVEICILNDRYEKVVKEKDQIKEDMKEKDVEIFNLNARYEKVVKENDQIKEKLKKNREELEECGEFLEDNQKEIDALKQKLLVRKGPGGGPHHR
jgi:chromosome segregation ATPase